jgi:hypothetical protein
VDADRKNSDSADIYLIIDPIAQKFVEDSYLAKWGEEHYHIHNGTSNEGDKERQVKEYTEKVHSESDAADEIESDSENEDEVYVPDGDESEDENDRHPWK